MLASLRFVFHDGMFSGDGAGFENYPHRKQKQALNAYWQGIKATYPDAFTRKHRRRYHLQGNIGAHVFHRIFPEVLVMAWRDSSVVDSSLYEAILHNGLFALNGRNLYGEKVCGIDFWRVGPEGASDGYDNETGYGLLAEKIAYNLVFSLENPRPPKP